MFSGPGNQVEACTRCLFVLFSMVKLLTNKQTSFPWQLSWAIFIGLCQWTAKLWFTSFICLCELTLDICLTIFSLSKLWILLVLWNFPNHHKFCNSLTSFLIELWLWASFVTKFLLIYCSKLHSKRACQFFNKETRLNFFYSFLKICWGKPVDKF